MDGNVEHFFFQKSQVANLQILVSFPAHVEERIGIHVKVNTFDPVDPIVVGSHDLALVGHFQDAGTNAPRKNTLKYLKYHEIRLV